MEQEKYPTCACGKVSFPSQKIAQEKVNLIKNFGKKKIPKRSYYSKECSAWHITHFKSKPKKKKEYHGK